MFAPAVTGCGAKTGLEAPDVADVIDAAPDRPEVAICVEPPRDGGPNVIFVDLTTDAQVAVADVLFVIDRTGSMDQEIDNIRNSLRSVIVPGLVRAIPDLQLGVVTYSDFPIEPYGAAEDRPLSIDRPMTSDFVALQGALGNIRASGGGDNPEAMVEALYQIATGEGLPPYIPRAPGCPSIGIGYACFRPRAQPVIVLIADAPSHNGPARPDGSPSHPYSRTSFAPFPAPHTYEQMITVLMERLRPRVIGINSGVAPFSGRDDLVRIAQDTGTLGADGRPLVFDISPDGTGLSEQVVTAIQRFTAEVRLNVSARAIDIDGSGGANLVRAIRPQRAIPMDRIERFDDRTFYGVVPGTRLVFALEIDTSRVVPMDREQRFRVRVEFLAEGRPTLGFRDVDIVVPPQTQMCPR